MKIAVFSDTHGRTRGMLRAIRNEAPDLVFHLGDNEKDALSVNRQNPVQAGHPLASAGRKVFILEIKEFIIVQGHLDR